MPWDKRPSQKQNSLSIAKKLVAKTVGLNQLGFEEWSR